MKIELKEVEVIYILHVLRMRYKHVKDETAQKIHEEILKQAKY